LPSSGKVIIAGAGVGGLTAALAIAQRGFSVVLFEQAEKLEETGAGIQLSPNASRLLIALGLEEQLRQHVARPAELRIMDAHGDRLLAMAPLGTAAEERYGAPYWVIHRRDLQAVLVKAVQAHPNIVLELGERVEDFALCESDVTVSTLAAHRRGEERGMALIGADGLWSSMRARLGHRTAPRFAHHTAWRALVCADALASDICVPALHLWLGRDAHLVHYPVRRNTLMNVVAIMRDDWREPGWSAPGEPSQILTRYPADAWPARARAILAAAQLWRKWALYDRAPFLPWGKGPITLLGDAAHPMLPYLAQGAAAAIEDAAVLARELAHRPTEPASAMRLYERARHRRTARIQHAARRNGMIYHLGGAPALLRGFALQFMSGPRMLARYDWLYGWKPT
jgi:salicylate hydroxylase